MVDGVSVKISWELFDQRERFMEILLRDDGVSEKFSTVDITTAHPAVFKPSTP